VKERQAAAARRCDDFVGPVVLIMVVVQTAPVRTRRLKLNIWYPVILTLSFSFESPFFSRPWSLNRGSKFAGVSSDTIAGANPSLLAYSPAVSNLFKKSHPAVLFSELS
jgi:hypothetical protein